MADRRHWFFCNMMIASVIFVTSAAAQTSTIAAQSAQDSAYHAHDVAVSVQTVALSAYHRQLTLTGSVAARNLINLGFRASGQVIERYADIGQQVEAGTLLARIDAVNEQAALQSAEASLLAARAQLTQAVANYSRQDALLKQGFTTRSQFGSAQEAKQRAQSALQNAQSQLKNAQDMMDYTQLRAPRAGVVTARNIEAGQLVQAAQTAYVIAADGERDAVFDVQEGLAAHAENGAAGVDLPPVSLSLISDPSVTASGHIREVAPVVNAKTGTVRIKVEIETPPPAMTLAGAVTASLSLPAQQAIVLPWSALTSKNGKPAVWVVEPKSRQVRAVPVDILDYEREKVIISQGLEDGQLVVTRGGQLLGEGARVEILQQDNQKVAP